jgi:hypothetical protein
MMLSSDFTLFKGYRSTKKDADHAECGESEERNHKDGHRSLLIRILPPALLQSGDGDHPFL